MDLVKIGVLAAAFLVLLLLGRRFSPESVIVPQPPQPPAPDGLPESIYPPDQIRHMPAVVGSELPFPISLPPITRSPEGLYNRPEVLNYYFSEIDLIRGPADPKCFCDDFYLELQVPGDSHPWTSQYLVASPAGLQKELDSQSYSALYLDSNTIVVPKWDVAAILQAVMNEIMQNWVHSGADDGAEDAESLSDRQIGA